MKLHLPKQLFTALLAAIACWQPVTATDYTYGTDDNNAADKLTAPTADDTITFDKESGYLTSNGGTINAKVIINELTLTNGYSNTTYTFTNTVTGTGNFSFVGSAGGDNQHYVFNGDASGYEGNMSIANSKTGSFTFNNQSGTGTISGANVTVNANNATMNNSAITVSTVNVSGTTSFAGTVDTGALTIAADSAVTFSGNLTVGSTIVNNGSISLENGAKVVLEDISAFDNTGWGDAVDYSAESNGVQTIDVIYTIEKGSATSKLSSVWYQGSEQALDNGCLTEAADIYVVVSDEVTVGGNSATEGTADVAGFAVGENGTLVFAETQNSNLVKDVKGSGRVEVTLQTPTSGHSRGVQLGTDFHGTLAINSGWMDLTTFTTANDATLELHEGQHWNNGSKTLRQNIDLKATTADGYIFRNAGTLTLAGTVTGKYLALGTTVTNGGTLELAGADNDIEYIAVGSASNTMHLTISGDTAVNQIHSVNTNSTVTVSSGKNLTINGGTAEGDNASTIGKLESSAGTITLAEGVTLNIGSDSTASTSTIGTVVASSAGNTIHLNNKATLAGITTGTDSGTITLTGSGVYNFAAPTTNVTFSLPVTLHSTDWQGTVSLSGGHNLINLTDKLAQFVTDNSKLELKGLHAYAQNGTISQDLILTNKTSDGITSITKENLALRLDNGTSTANQTATFSGAISGPGSMAYTWGTVGAGGNATKKSTYIFSGDTSDWDGWFMNHEDSGKLVEVQFTKGGQVFDEAGNGGVIDRRDEGNSRMDVTINAGNGLTTDFYGTVMNARNLTISTATTFHKDITAATMTVTENTSITLGGGTTEAPITHSIGTLSAASGTVSVSSNGTLTLKGGTTEAPITHSIGTLSAASGTVSVAENGTLSLGTATHSIGTLTGGGLVTTAGNLSITNAPAGFTGALEVQGSTATVTNATSDFTLKNLTLDGSGSESGASFEIVARGTSGSTGYSYNIEQLTVSGTGTLANTNPSGAPGYQSQWNIGNLTNAEEGTSGVLNLNSWTKTDNRSIINLNGGDFAGEINLQGNSNTDTRKAALNVNAETAAADAVVSLSSSGQKVALGIGADRVVLKGINGSAGSIISGAQAYHKESTAYNGDDFNAIDTTFRTLVIDTNGTDDTAAVNSSTSATLGSYLNLEKQGAGTQTFSGDISGFNGTIEVTGGTLKFTSGFTASSATISQGAELKLSDTATVTNGTMSQVKLNSTGISSADTTGTTKGNILGANVAIAQLAEEASFTIQDMTLTNTTITAATTTQVKLQNVTANNVVLAQGKFSTDADMGVTVGMGGSEGTFSFAGGLAENEIITIKASTGASLTVDLGDLSCVTAMGPGKYDLSITLSGVTLDSYTDLADGAGITFAGWLGELISASSDVRVSFSAEEEATPAAAAESGATGVSYSTDSVGTVINITGLNVPEPASATLGLAALMMLCARRRRKA